MNILSKFKTIFTVLPTLSIVGGIIADLIALFYYMNFQFAFSEFLTGMKPEIYLLSIGYIIAFLGIMSGLIGVVWGSAKRKSMIGLLLCVMFFVVIS